MYYGKRWLMTTMSLISFVFCLIHAGNWLASWLGLKAKATSSRRLDLLPAVSSAENHSPPMIFGGPNAPRQEHYRATCVENALPARLVAGPTRHRIAVDRKHQHDPRNPRQYRDSAQSGHGQADRVLCRGVRCRSEERWVSY